MVKQEVKVNTHNAVRRTARVVTFRTLMCILAFLCSLAGCVSAQPTPAGVATAPEISARTEALEGILVRRLVAPGTLSEYAVFYLETGKRKAVILFNEKGYSAGFTAWEGMKVRVTGEEIEGRVGNAHKRDRGFRVDSITSAE